MTKGIKISDFIADTNSIIKPNIQTTRKSHKNKHYSYQLLVLFLIIITISGMIIANVTDFNFDNKICNVGSQIEKDWCYLDASINTEKTYCSRIKNPDLDKYCNAFVQNNDKICLKIEDLAAKDACYISLAIKNNDEKLCESVSNKLICLKKLK